MKYIIILVLSVILFQINCAQNRAKQLNQLSQYPSPMVENTRLHERVQIQNLPGVNFDIDYLLHKPVQVFIPDKIANSENVNLLIHFHGASFVSKYAVYYAKKPVILINVNLGSGSSAYEKPFSDSYKFDIILETVKKRLTKRYSNFNKFEKIIISSFSAGYGAVRAILKEPGNFDKIDGLILLDGLHTDYVPDHMALANGGKLNTEKLRDFHCFADHAVIGKKRLLITHSEIFPGTYASTTETAEYLIESLSLRRSPVLKWGPMGMQQISECIQNKFWVFGYAGNSAPDHIDFFHSLHYFLNFILEN